MNFMWRKVGIAQELVISFQIVFYNVFFAFILLDVMKG